MKRLLHEVWPLAAVVALTVVLTLQIPRKALLFESVSVPETRAYASVVSFDDAAYASVVQKARMSWQVRGAVGISSESRVDDVLGAEEELSSLQPLELDDEFSVPWRSVGETVPTVSLLPSTVALTSSLHPVATPPDDAAEARALRLELLELPESLQETE